MYDNALRLTYGSSALAFGATGSTRGIKAPKGLSRGNIREIHNCVTATFTATTTQAFIRIGHAGDADYFAELGMGTIAGGNGYGLRDAGSIFKVIDVANDTVAGVLTQILVTYVAATGGTPAGTADVTITIDWF